MGEHVTERFVEKLRASIRGQENSPEATSLLSHSPLKNLGRAMERLANNVQSHGIDKSMLFSPNFPRFAWRFAGTHSFWNANAKKNGLKKKDRARDFVIFAKYNSITTNSKSIIFRITFITL